MSGKFQTNTWLLVLLPLVMLVLVKTIQCNHIPPSEPYAQHYDPYSYGYDVEDNYGNKQWKQERSTSPHEVHGSYGYRDNHGVYREVTYVADKNGFRANIKTNEPGVKGTKDPASTSIESYYSPPPPSSAQSVSHSPSYSHSSSASAAASPPVYVRQQHVAAPSYYQR